MTEYEVAAENGHRVRVEAESEDEAVWLAIEQDPDIWYAGAYPVDGRPIGWDGGDAHEAMDDAEGIDNGDYR